MFIFHKVPYAELELREAVGDRDVLLKFSSIYVAIQSTWEEGDFKWETHPERDASKG